MRKNNLFTRRLLGTAAMVVAVSPFMVGGAVGQTSTASTSSSFGTPVDPGVRGGAPGAGCFLPGLGSDEQTFFFAAGGRFGEVDSVSNTLNDAANSPGLPANSGVATGSIAFCVNSPTHAQVTQTRQQGGGLGPRFNESSCATCHASPAVGGSSPATNPQVADEKVEGARNTQPSFISANGPVREARFIRNPNGTADGGVHDLFVITGRPDAQGCNITQPNFAQAVQQNNVIFRVPTPTFGAGQIENTPDGNLVADSAAIATQQKNNGITSGNFNHSGNDGTITRFGWKAQNKSLLIFSGEAYNVEQGVTNDNFPNERDDSNGCRFNPLPEDTTNLTNPNTSGFAPSDFSSDIVNFTEFMRFSAGPTPAASTASTIRGQSAFNQVGCNLCHLPQHTTGKSAFTNQSNVTYTPFSDVALHTMGTGLQDQVSQGAANGQQFRSAPLWGVGQRVFFLHDGRTSNLLTAIEDHASAGSEANTVINNFNALPVGSRQDILNFLRSL